MNKESIHDSIKMIGNLKGNMDKLLKIQAQAISQLPPEYSNELSFAIKDISVIKEAIRKGDLDKLNELTQRYADSNRTN
jgi:hypothetical protein